jgi:NADH dehydrogenase
VEVAALDFGHPSALAESLQGATTLYNTYWIRFPHGQVNYEAAIENTRTLLKAAREAGVGRVVHISVTSPSKDSPLPYYRGKALVEEAVIHSQLPYAIIRPSLLFGAGDILLNNMAWFLRRFPVFAIPGRGDYRMQPVFVDDVAQLSIQAGQQEQNIILDAIGPEVYTFTELVVLLAQKTRSRAVFVHVSPVLALWMVRFLGYLVYDLVLTGEELAGLMSNLLLSQGQPTGRVRFSEWLSQNADSVGVKYASEMDRHYR